MTTQRLSSQNTVKHKASKRSFKHSLSHVSNPFPRVVPIWLEECFSHSTKEAFSG